MTELNRLEKSAADLNDESDKFRAKFQAIEEVLLKIHMGVEVEVDGWGYGRLPNRRWQFYKVSGTNRVAVLELRRADRLGLADALGKIIDKLIAVADEQKRQHEKANDMLDEAMKRLS
jgi:hypothetical protein